MRFERVMCNPADSSLWIPDYNKIEKDPECK